MAEEIKDGTSDDCQNVEGGNCPTRMKGEDAEPPGGSSRSCQVANFPCDGVLAAGAQLLLPFWKYG